MQENQNQFTTQNSDRSFSKRNPCVIAVAGEAISLSTSYSNMPWIGSILKFKLPIESLYAFAFVTSIDTTLSEPIIGLAYQAQEIDQELISAASSAYQDSVTYKVTAIILGYFNNNQAVNQILDNPVVNITYGMPPKIPLLFTEANELSHDEIRSIVLSNPTLFFARLIEIDGYEKILPAFFYYINTNSVFSEQEMDHIHLSFLDAFFATQQKDELLKTRITLNTVRQNFPEASPSHADNLTVSFQTIYPDSSQTHFQQH